MNLRPSSGGQGGGGLETALPQGHTPPWEDPPGTACRQPARLGLLSGMKIHLPRRKVVRGRGGVGSHESQAKFRWGAWKPPSLSRPPPNTTTTRGGPWGTQPVVSSEMQMPPQPGLFQGLSFARAMAVP